MLQLLSLALGLLASLHLAAAACTQPRQRVEWRMFTDTQKQAYIDAVLCLQGSPSQSPTTGAEKTRFDDFQGSHIALSDIIHEVGQFLPWHRYMIWTYETLLIEECGYTGTQPYWNETMDVAHGFTNSPLLNGDDPLSFGGDGDSQQDNCVTTGPFSDYILHLGPGQNLTNHCLTREINNVNITRNSQSAIDRCLAFDTFENAWPCIENGPHAVGHNGVGGEMIDTYSSPGDPIFYLHHSWVDKLWADWEDLDKDARIFDIAGFTTQIPDGGDTNGLEPTTLDYVLSISGIAPDVTVKDVMDIEGDTLCYVYV